MKFCWSFGNQWFLFSKNLTVPVWNLRKQESGNEGFWFYLPVPLTCCSQVTFLTFPPQSKAPLHYLLMEPQGCGYDSWAAVSRLVLLLLSLRTELCCNTWWIKTWSDHGLIKHTEVVLADYSAGKAVNVSAELQAQLALHTVFIQSVRAKETLLQMQLLYQPSLKFWCTQTSQ